MESRTMKKIIAIFAMAAALGANAFWNNNNAPWNNGYNNYGYQNDNGIFAYNPYDYWDPRWYMEEMSNMVDEFDDEFNNNNNGWNNGYGYNPYNNGPWNYNNAPWNRTAPAAPAAPEAAAK